MNNNSQNFESFIEVFKKFLFVVFLAFSIIISFLLPENIPAHFNANGEVDRWANKFFFFLLPTIGFVVYFLIYFIKQYVIFLQKNNAIDIENQIGNKVIIFSLLQISVLLVFIIIIVALYLVSQNAILNIGKWFLPFTIIIICFPTFFYFIDNYKVKS